MITAILQPYFFPYIGYFQLMDAVDAFIFLDDVQYIDRGWVNRNRVRGDNGHKWLSFPVVAGARSLPINDRRYVLGTEVERARSRVTAAYRTAPAYRDVMPILDDLLAFEDANVARFNANLLTTIAGRLGISCRFLTSSAMGNIRGLRGQDRIVDICRETGTKRYINPIGGMELYDAATFADAGIELRFLQTRVPSVAAEPESAAFLSIIDTLMFHSWNGTHNLLSVYDLVEGTKLATRP